MIIVSNGLPGLPRCIPILKPGLPLSRKVTVLGARAGLPRLEPVTLPAAGRRFKTIPTIAG